MYYLLTNSIRNILILLNITVMPSPLPLSRNSKIKGRERGVL